MERAIRIDDAGDGPDEIHVVSFGDRAAFEAYRTDPAIAALASTRDEVIARTVVWSGRAIDYQPIS